MSVEIAPSQPPRQEPAAEYVVALARLNAADRALVGSKAANLGELRHAGLPVPDGFCVTTDAFRRFLAEGGSGEFIQCELGALDLKQPALVRAAAARLRERLLALPVPADIQRAVVDAWRAHWAGREDIPLAVRSSATAEDLPTASFAGQHDSILNVVGEEALLRALRTCWASLFAERALAYRGRQDVDHTRVAMAVVVQEMVPADRAGVAFTADPMDAGPTRGERILIEAAPGVGEAIVSGGVSPDRIVVDKRTLAILEQRAGREGAVCLSAERARALAELARKVEGLFGAPQDIEWALAGDRLWLLQARPITALAPVAPLRPGADRAVWSSVNVGELMPEVATPMAWAIVKRTVDQVFTPILRMLGIDMVQEPWIALIAGRIYANLSVFARLISAMPGTSRMKLGEAFGGHGAGLEEIERILKTPDPRGLWRRRLGLLRAMPWLLFWFLGHLNVRRGREAVAAYAAKVGRLDGTGTAAMSEAELAARLREVLGLLHEDSRLAHQAIAHAGVGMVFTNSLFQVARRWLGDEHGAIANRLLSGAGEMASAEAALDLWLLAEWVRPQRDLAEILRAEGAGDISQRLAQVTGGREFLERWARWNAHHGHHAYAELDVAQRRWSESPEYVLALVRTYLATPVETGLDVRRQRGQAEREKLLADCRARVGWWRRPIFDFLLRRARAGLVLRENLKNEVIRTVAAARQVLLEAGRRLTKSGTLHAPEDIFLLTPEEVDRVLCGARDASLGAAIALRRQEFARNQQLCPPPVIVGRFDPDRAPGTTCASEAADPNVLRGLAVSAGSATGPARVLLRADGGEQVQPGEILIAPFTDPGWTPHFLNAAGLVVDMGGMFSHGSVVAREYGLPAVVNVGTATQRIRTGQTVTVDGDRGVVTIGETPEPRASGRS
jgi:rifampicin phosphotransferase